MAAAHQILLGIDTSVTCPKCEHEFSLEQGFAKKARTPHVLKLLGDGAQVNVELIVFQ